MENQLFSLQNIYLICRPLVYRNTRYSFPTRQTSTPRPAALLATHYHQSAFKLTNPTKLPVPNYGRRMNTYGEMEVNLHIHAF